MLKIPIYEYITMSVQHSVINYGKRPNFLNSILYSVCRIYSNVFWKLSHLSPPPPPPTYLVSQTTPAPSAGPQSSWSRTSSTVRKHFVLACFKLFCHFESVHLYSKLQYLYIGRHALAIVYSTWYGFRFFFTPIVLNNRFKLHVSFPTYIVKVTD